MNEAAVEIAQETTVVDPRPAWTRLSIHRQDQAMRVRVDHAADAVYVNLTDRPIKESEEVADGMLWTTTRPAESSEWKFSTRRNGLTILRC